LVFIVEFYCNQYAFDRSIQLDNTIMPLCKLAYQKYTTVHVH